MSIDPKELPQLIKAQLHADPEFNQLSLLQKKAIEDICTLTHQYSFALGERSGIAKVCEIYNKPT